MQTICSKHPVWLWEAILTKQATISIKPCLTMYSVAPDTDLTHRFGFLSWSWTSFVTMALTGYLTEPGYHHHACSAHLTQVLCDCHFCWWGHCLCQSCCHPDSWFLYPLRRNASLAVLWYLSTCPNIDSLVDFKCSWDWEPKNMHSESSSEAQWHKIYFIWYLGRVRESSLDQTDFPNVTQQVSGNSETALLIS